jgi:hypothetical protein
MSEELDTTPTEKLLAAFDITLEEILIGIFKKFLNDPGWKQVTKLQKQTTRSQVREACVAADVELGEIYAETGHLGDVETSKYRDMNLDDYLTYTHGLIIQAGRILDTVVTIFNRNKQEHPDKQLVVLMDLLTTKIQAYQRDVGLIRDKRRADGTSCTFTTAVVDHIMQHLLENNCLGGGY